MRVWILSVIHWIFGAIFLGIGLFEILKLNTFSISESTAYIWLNLVTGALIIIGGMLFTKNRIKPSKNSFFNVN